MESVFEQFMALVKQTPGPALFWLLAVLIGVGIGLAVLFEEIHRSDARKASDRDRSPATPGPPRDAPDMVEGATAFMDHRQLAFNGSSPEH